MAMAIPPPISSPFIRGFRAAAAAAQTKTMNFFGSIAFPFRVWQALCQSPFVLAEIPEFIPRQFNKTYFIRAAALISAFAAFLIWGGLNSLRKHSDQWYALGSTFLLVTHGVFAVAIIIESFANRAGQRDLLRGINAIDAILINRIGIRLDYAQQRRSHRGRFNYFMAIRLVSLLTTLLRCMANAELKYVDVIGLIVVQVIVTFIPLRMFQFTIFVDIVRQRYRAVNRHIDQLVLNGWHHAAAVADCRWQAMAAVAHVNRAEIAQRWQSVDEFELPLRLKQVSQLLHQRSQQINRVFAASLATCFFKDFVSVVIFTYFSFEESLLSDSLILYACSTIHSIMRINDIRVVSSACEDASVEASFLCVQFFQFCVCLHIIFFSLKMERKKSQKSISFP